MKLLAASFLLLITLGVPARTISVAKKTPAPQCDESLWKHVYAGTFGTEHKRLKVIDTCKTVTGTIVYAKGEDDGDFHLRLHLDPGQEGLLNAKNRKATKSGGQGGNLVIEPICHKEPIQDDTVREGVCNGFSQDIPAMNLSETSKIILTH